ncbi:MAG: division/cell wall cluster transcriptional repressor MraZ [Patescibacteria group bacterium]|nr:division/cell wall cluster transcriptional repressor MraZ [bacterium]MDZ4226884.1 division/cell wall cluster transcriptional repressor MraZ [Patescibacteria group bacterium]
MADLLIGEYEHTLDEKKRVSIPKVYRSALGKRIVITRGLDNCLIIYARPAWGKFAEKLQALSFVQAETRGISRFLLSGAAEIEVDGVGRILIPDHQKEFAGLKKKVVFAGVSDRVEVWDADRWHAYKRRIDKDAERMAKKLGEIGAL